MASRIAFPVKATHDLRQGNSPVIKAGTPGEIMEMTGNGPVTYTVAFWPAGLTGGTVTVSGLRRTDLREA